MVVQVQAGDGETMLACEIGTLDPDSTDDSTVVEWKIAPDAPDGLILTQHGEAIVRDTSVHTETSTLDNSFTAEHVVVRESDLALQVRSTRATAGDVVTMTATLNNAGPSDAADSVVDFFLPGGVTLVDSTNGCTQENQFVRCDVGDLPLGARVNVFAAFQIASSFRGSLETLVEASSASFEVNSDDNFVEVAGTVAASAQLRATITPTQTRVSEGDMVDYVVTITNNGPSTATDVYVQLGTPYTAFVEDVQIGGESTTLDQLTIEAGTTLTATVTVRTVEDDHDAPMVLSLSADAAEAPVVTATSARVRVFNVAPTAVVSGTLTLDEGEIGVLSARTDDPGSNYDDFEIAWDLDGDGAFDDSTEPAVRFDARNLDGPTTQRVRVRVTDDEGGETIARATVTIRNVAPTVTTGLPQTQRYDTAFTVPFEAFDPGANDLKSAQVDWGDGTRSQVTLGSGGKDEQATHTYNKIGRFTANVCANDNDRGQGCATVILNAVCRDNGLLVELSTRMGTLIVTMSNASGTVTIPAGLPFTLYDGTTVVRTFTLGQALAVGASRTLEYPLGDIDGGATIRLAVDDDGTGAKTTDLCSGSVEATVRDTFRVFLPLVHGEASPTTATPVATLLETPIAEYEVSIGEIFATQTIMMPTDLPSGGTFYLSSSPTELLQSRVDDRITLKIDGAEVYSYTYGAPPERVSLRGPTRPYVVYPALVSIPREAVEKLAGKAVTIELSDVYGVYGSASPLYIVHSSR